jgi:flagellar biosynthetic protein FliQ
MTTDFVIWITREVLTTAILILLPVLGSTLIIGLTVGVIQAVTQIQEMTLAFVPKIVFVGVVIFVLMPWFLELLMGLFLEIFNQIVLVSVA